MPIEVDKRNFSKNQASNARKNFLESKADELSKNILPGGHTLLVKRVSPMSGGAALLDSESAPVATRSLVEEALAYVSEAADLLGFDADKPAEFVPDPHVQVTSSGVSSVNLHQTYRGIPVFSMQRKVTFSAQNELTSVDGDNAPIASGFDIEPKIRADEAVLEAAKYLAVSEEDVDGFGEPLPSIELDLTGFKPSKPITFDLSSRPTVFAPGPFGDHIRASLEIFYTGDDTRLGWLIELTLPKGQGIYDVIVSCDDKPREILYCKNKVHSIISGTVFETNPGEKDRVSVSFPRPIGDYPVESFGVLPAKFPFAWVDDGHTFGIGTIAYLADNQKHLKGTINGVNLSFNPANADDDDQKVLNIFYFCNYMHDFFYILGFDEASGNFQTVNFSGLGLGNDPVEARSHSGPVYGTANMSTRPDGEPGVMNMGLVSRTGRHTAFDADVVYHEFVHGVTNRLVGGRMNHRALEQIQSGGMGEGWGDYFALTIQNYAKAADKEKVVTGAWVTDNPNGIRGLPYNSAFPDGFGNLGKGRYTRVHTIGEIWCATLMEMNRKLGEALNSKQRGHKVGWQIVVDSLKLVRANPSFLDCRNGILQALEDMHKANRLDANEFAACKTAVWKVFAHFGMGKNATCMGASLQGIVADNTVP